ncbi:hypothetical protein [Thalassotalea profundi]|uniref:Uncharacterized protein n=1 Tax=Thalassotalea profundi TaxID=2036687 RepID=A0ABQ3ISH1_9GAMM|nr:hypothetical protein [Thalassotalea profundi]GHE91594.1 hypothetical protein GCM10011501_21220 [Thalassotalea profundi]
MSNEINWYCVDLGDAITATTRLFSLQDQLTTIYQQSDNREQMLALYRHESGEIHCKVTLYISSAFQQALCLPDAIACKAPQHNDLTILVGKL